MSKFDLAKFYDDKVRWSAETFGPGDRYKGIVEHIRRELKEIAAKPSDLVEWVDVALLAMDGAWRSAGVDGAAFQTALENRLDRLTRARGRSGGHPTEHWTEVVASIRSFVRAVEAAPSDLWQWMVLVSLAMDGACVAAGADRETFYAALEAKQAKNVARAWPDWRSLAPGEVSEHIKSPAETDRDVHTEHCCPVHGCKYGDADEHGCTVVSGKRTRSQDAGWCQEPGMVDDPAACRWPGERMPGPDYDDDNEVSGAGQGTESSLTAERLATLWAQYTQGLFWRRPDLAHAALGALLEEVEELRAELSAGAPHAMMAESAYNENMEAAYDAGLNHGFEVGQAATRLEKRVPVSAHEAQEWKRTALAKLGVRS